MSGVVRPECGIELICSNESQKNYTVTEEQCLDDDVIRNATCTLRGYDCEKNNSKTWEGPAVVQTITFNVSSTGLLICFSNSINYSNTTDPSNIANPTGATPTNNTSYIIVTTVAILFLIMAIVTIAIGK